MLDNGLIWPLQVRTGNYIDNLKRETMVLIWPLIYNLQTLCLCIVQVSACVDIFNTKHNCLACTVQNMFPKCGIFQGVVLLIAVLAVYVKNSESNDTKEKLYCIKCIQ